jgi:hypothetical protein
MIENERIKLFANFCNIVAAGFIITGGVGPLFTLAYSRSYDGTDWAEILSGSCLCLLIGAGLHFRGIGKLGELR